MSHGYRCPCLPCRVERSAADRQHYVSKSARLDAVAAQMREHNHRNIAIRQAAVRRSAAAKAAVANAGESA